MTTVAGEALGRSEQALRLTKLRGPRASGWNECAVPGRRATVATKTALRTTIMMIDDYGMALTTLCADDQV